MRSGRSDVHGEGIGEHLVAGDNILVQQHGEVLGIDRGEIQRNGTEGTRSRDKERREVESKFLKPVLLFGATRPPIDLYHAVTNVTSKNLVLAFSGGDIRGRLALTVCDDEVTLERSDGLQTCRCATARTTCSDKTQRGKQVLATV